MLFFFSPKTTPYVRAHNPTKELGLPINTSSAEPWVVIVSPTHGGYLLPLRRSLSLPFVSRESAEFFATTLCPGPSTAILTFLLLMLFFLVSHPFSVPWSFFSPWMFSGPGTTPGSSGFVFSRIVF